MVAHALFFMEKTYVDLYKSSVVASNSGKTHNFIGPTF
jgi:hypothetical protein